MIHVEDWHCDPSSNLCFRFHYIADKYDPHELRRITEFKLYDEVVQREEPHHVDSDLLDMEGAHLADPNGACVSE